MITTNLPLVLTMATETESPTSRDYLEEDDLLDFDDAESLASLEDDEEYHPPEAIIAEFTGSNGHVWFLVKWQDCPLVRSSWECGAILEDHPLILTNWLAEKQNQTEGKSKPFDLSAFNKIVLEVETAERQRRILRRLKRRVKGVLAAISSS